MKLEIIEKKEQKLLSRLEVKARTGFEGSATPSNDDVKAAIAKETGKDVKLVVVQNIYTDFGTASATIFAHVYDNEEKLNELEITHKKAKKGEAKEGEAAPAEEKPVEEKKEEPKAEEEGKKEEKPAEEKPAKEE
jgi:ribosomal protein S24E|tara:strand:+ start:359 stop:763 length:405 start_codon:yes stop_codon:yes gene_type:complete